MANLIKAKLNTLYHTDKRFICFGIDDGLIYTGDFVEKDLEFLIENWGKTVEIYRDELRGSWKIIKGDWVARKVVSDE